MRILLAARMRPANLWFLSSVSALSVGPLSRSAPCSSSLSSAVNVLIVDHLNVNHEKGRHDLLTAFYVDVLGCALDPRKVENLERGKGTLWANVGIHQFHLPEGKPDAQKLDGQITLGYDSLDGVKRRLMDPPSVLLDSLFEASEGVDGTLVLVDPWGTRFQLVSFDDEPAGDPRGAQAGHPSEARALVDLTFHVGAGTSLAGIGRFYEHVLGIPVLSCDDHSVVLSAGGQPRSDGTARQTLTFTRIDRAVVAHEQVDTDGEGVSTCHSLCRDVPHGPSQIPSHACRLYAAPLPQELINLGPHISLYLRDLRAAYQRADELGLCFVNHRFKRRAYTEEDAIEQCMFRILDVNDPGFHPLLTCRGACPAQQTRTHGQVKHPRATRHTWAIAVPTWSKWHHSLAPRAIRAHRWWIRTMWQQVRFYSWSMRCVPPSRQTAQSTSRAH